MAASKISPQERLVRKRTAARLRQQRCRARKRQAMMERAAKSSSTAKEYTPNSPSKPKPSLPPRKLWKSRIGSFNPQSDYWSDDSAVRSRASSFDSISSTSTFDSHSTTTEDLRYNYSSSRSPSPSSVDSRMVPSPVRFDRRLEEETAIDAMLSLKSSRRLRRPVPVPALPRAPIVYANCWNPMVFQSRPRLYVPYAA